LLTPSAGSGVTLQAGALVSLKVLAELGKGLYRVSLGGRELSAQSSSPLLIGALLKARAERAGTPSPGTSAEGGSLVLRILASAAEKQAEILSGLGISPDKAALAALAASLAEGIKPDGSRLIRMRRAIASGKEGEEGQRAAFAARLEAKGLESSPAFVDTLVALAGGGNGDDASAGEGSRDEPERLESAEQPGSGAGEDELLPALAGLLQKFFTQSGPDSGLLGLYNHARGDRGEVLVPFLFELGFIEFRGSFLLHLPHIVGGPLVVEGRFRASKQGEDDPKGSFWGFVLETTARGGSILRLGPPEARDFSGLESSLAASGCLLKIDVGGSEAIGPEEVDAHA
ncbi:MAG: hypothetical protein WCL50_13020, partial [Spirochaetota bacterium]